jgi:hypothetical protein
MLSVVNIRAYVDDKPKNEIVQDKCSVFLNQA